MINDKKITRREFLNSAVRYTLFASTALLCGISLRKFHKKKDCPLTYVTPLTEQCIICNIKKSCPTARVKPGS